MALEEQDVTDLPDQNIGGAAAQPAAPMPPAVAPVDGIDAPGVAGPDEFGALLIEDAGDVDVEVEVQKPNTPAAAPASKETPPATVPPVTPAPAPVAPAAAPPAPAAPAPAVPAATPEAPAAVPAAPAAAPEVKPLTMEDIQKNYRESRANAEQLLATAHYAITPELAEELDTNMASAIPKLMAKVYMDSTTAAVSHMVTHLPQMIHAVIEGQKNAGEAETEFFKVWPQLQEQKDAVIKFGQAYRQMFPNASRSEFIQNVGAQVVVALKLPVGGTPTAQQQQAAPSVAPFVPAGAGGVGAGMPAPGSANLNPFAALADLPDESDE